MSDPHLPLEYYSSQEFFDVEKQKIFDRLPRYHGHQLMVRDSGSYHTLPQFDHARTLIRQNDKIRSVSNICRHRQAVMLHGSGEINNIVCPLHRWTYDLSGQLIGAPYFDQDPCRHLDQISLNSWNGMLFDRSCEALFSDMRQIPFFDHLDFRDYVFHSYQIHNCDYNWKTFIEVYLDDYHVNPFHLGLGRFVNCDDLRWHFGKYHSVQAVGLGDLSRTSTPVYTNWHKAVRKAHKEDLPKYGAIWMTIYPNIMIEWYPKTLVVSQLVPISPGKTANIVEFYYPEDIAYFDETYIAAQQAAYNETMLEDDEIAERMDRGRRALLKEGQQDHGPFHSPTEDGIPRFYDFINGIICD